MGKERDVKRSRSSNGEGADENKELGVLSKERERENNKRFFGNPEKA